MKSPHGILPWLILLSLSAQTPAVTDSDSVAQRWRRIAEHQDALQPARTFPYQHCFERAARAHGLPTALLLAVARGESDFDPKARSHADALGLMQILWPGTARHLGITRKTALFEPCTNVDAGARYLRELLARYGGDLHLALAAYNYGPGRIAQDGRNVPRGAAWYSGYVLGHLDYVTGGAQTPPGAANYADEGRMELIRFSRPFRASALADSLSNRYPWLRLEVFRRPAGHFGVVLLFRDQGERDRALERLRTIGVAPT